MTLSFEWDPRKAASNFAKHGVSFEEAATAFGDPLSLSIPDASHSQLETRLVLLGQTRPGRLVVVVPTERDLTIRLLGARLATRQERHTYEEDV